MENGLTSTSVTALVWLLIAIMVVAVASKYIRVPYTVALVVAGLFIAFTPIKLTIDVTPDVILFIFLPALLFESAYNLHFADVRDNLRPITLLAVPGVILTALFLAAAVHFAAGVGWETALLFGAIMSATDPVSVLAVFRQIGAPRRLSVILEGESLFNDGTALVLFAIILSGLVGGHGIELGPGLVQFVVVVVGAVALGAATGYVASFLLSRVNDYLIETAMTLVVAYGTYLLAVRVGVSGVIAVVVAALVVGNYGRQAAMSPTTRLAVSSTWEFFGFLANSFIFVLIGLELNSTKLLLFVGPTLLAIIAVLAVRAVVVAAASWLLRYIHRPIPMRWQAVLVWGGLRGSLALAMALSLPVTLAGGEPFAERDLLQVMTYGVILFSLLVQALTMKPLLRRLGLVQSHERQEEYETISVRKGMVSAAIAEIERMGRAGGLAKDDAEELRRAYEARLALLDQELGALQLGDEDLKREQLRAVRRRLLQIEKAVVGQRFVDGAISEESMRRLQSELDEELHNLDQAEEPDLESEAPSPRTPAPEQDSQGAPGVAQAASDEL
ncbi:MAG: Na+/H+ antiporter [Chloroflexia bacterium]